jgi:hypothetical protein
MSKYGMSKEASDGIWHAVSLLESDKRTQTAAILTMARVNIETTISELASIENDDGRIPETIWNMRNAALEKARVKV